jgi:ferredoxin
MLKIELDRDRCEGYGLCEDSAPELFAVDDEGVLELLQETVPTDLREKAKRAVEACPVAALGLADRGDRD